ncbi:hypothetical protein [Nocardia wallacei]|uniref:hypothetical protein n=1 Tax=Nocardia wallacei TaxID=480035 RepID=UPI00245758F8|nr:hypothetical protein [Nocardia wallacei]
MAGPTVRLNNATVRRLLRRQFREPVNALARALADEIGGEDVQVDEYTTDRSAAAVRVYTERQTVDGALTRAAAALGLEVRAK